MSVHYKFKSALEYDTVTFDGLHISVKDLKNSIIQQKRIGKNTDFDLQVTNAQTKEVYEDENVLIPKNTSLLIARIPTSAQTKTKQWEGYGGDATPPTKLDEGGPIAKAVDLSSLDAPEDDKIKAMMSQSTQDYDPSNYMKIRGANQMGAVPPNYRCYKCHQTGHWIKDCPLSKGPEPIEIKKSTGIPLSFMVPVEGPQVQGAMMTPNGSYAVPVLDHQTYTQKQTAAPAPVQDVKPEIPEDLLCSICSDLLTDAVMIPCCGNSFCDECIRSFLLESEEHECPDCHEKDISPATLIPNRFLRNSVANFKNTTGYVKKPVYKQSLRLEEPAEVKAKEAVPAQPAEPSKVETEEKTVISEADSTEHAKTEEKEEEVKHSPKTETEAIPEGPPGVSPVESPRTQSISKRVNSNREPRERTSVSRPHKHRSRDESPRRHHRNHRNSPYRDSGRPEERPGTPTVDEPGVPSNSNYPPPEVRPYNAPPMMGMVPPMQGPPPAMPPGYANPPAPMGTFPPTNGPPPNFRLPPPGAPPYMPPGPYQVPPRPMFDTTRPPMSGPPPMYNPSYQGSRSHHRDYGMGDRRMRGRTPSGVIDDPLAAFNRMLREKDERERRAKRQRRSSYSRSRSRSRSYSRSPRRMRSRSPRRRQSRSRSRSFSISRSRSRSFSGSLRGSPFRDFSPRHSPPRRRGPSRYRSPVRSPPRHRFKDGHQFRDRDYDHDHDRERDYGRGDDRGYSRDRDHRGGGRDDHHDRDRDRDYGGYGYDGYDDRSRSKPWGQHRGPPPPQQQAQQQPPPPPPDGYYQAEMQHPYQPPPNRYPPREYPPPPYANKEPHGMPPTMMAARRYEDVAPPGVEEPPIPGLENTRFEERFDRFPSPGREQKREEKSKEKKKHERSKSPEKKRSPSVRRKSKSKDKESPEKHKRKKREGSSDRDKKNASDEEKSKKNKDRKKKKDKKDSDKKKRKEKREKHKEKEKKHKDEVKEEVPAPKEEEKKEPPQEVVEEAIEEQKQDLYDDMLTEGVDTKVMENYGKIRESGSPLKEEDFDLKVPEKIEEPEVQKDFEDSENILEIHPTDIDLKTELDVKNEMLAHLPEKSKWEVEDDVTPHSQTSPKESGRDTKSDKSGKVTNEVLKRAENAIFAKAINAIRPIEIKKISTDRAKLYSGEKEEPKDEEVDVKSVLMSEDKSSERKKIEAPSQPPVRLSVKERLGIKIDDIDRIVKVDRNKSRSISPFTRRVNETNRNYGIGERRVEVVDRRRRERSRHRDRNRRDFRRDEFPRRDRRERTDGRRRDEKRRDRSKSKTRPHAEEDKKEKRKRSKSRSDSEERKRKKRDKKVKKDKTKKHKEEEEEKKDEEKVDELKVKSAAEKRKPTIDEANFEPDYDLESESEKEDKREKKSEEKRSSSSSDSSESSSEDEKKRKKHKKHRKKKSRRDSSSSSSDSDSESTDEDKERKRKKHKKKQKKRKKSKHK